MGLALGKQTQPDNVSHPEPGVDNTPPGKHTLTEQVAGQVHEQMKQACDGRQDDACFIQPEDRTRLDRDIDVNITGAAQNWATALMGKRLTLLSSHKEGWNSLWKIGVAVALTMVTEGADIGVEALAEYLESSTTMKAVASTLLHRKETVSGALELAGSLVEMHAEKNINETAEETNNAAANFLASLSEGPVSWSNHLMKSYPKMLDDWGRLLLLGVTDPKIMSVHGFEKQITALLERWEKQVNAIGDVHAGPGDVETVVWVSPRGGGKPRLARVSSYVPLGLNEGGRGKATPKFFRQWIDDDMVPYALDAQRERDVGDMTPITLGRVSIVV